MEMELVCTMFAKICMVYLHLHSVNFVSIKWHFYIWSLKLMFGFLSIEKRQIISHWGSISLGLGEALIIFWSFRDIGLLDDFGRLTFAYLLSQVWSVQESNASDLSKLTIFQCKEIYLKMKRK